MSGPRHAAVALDDARRFGVSARSASSALLRARAAEAAVTQPARTGGRHGNAPPA